LFREIISPQLEQNPPFKGEIEIDESYFGSKRQESKEKRYELGIL